MEKSSLRFCRLLVAALLVTGSVVLATSAYVNGPPPSSESPISLSAPFDRFHPFGGSNGAVPTPTPETHTFTVPVQIGSSSDTTASPASVTMTSGDYAVNATLVVQLNSGPTFGKGASFALTGVDEALTLNVGETMTCDNTASAPDIGDMVGSPDGDWGGFFSIGVTVVPNAATTCTCTSTGAIFTNPIEQTVVLHIGTGSSTSNVPTPTVVTLTKL